MEFLRVNGASMRYLLTGFVVLLFAFPVRPLFCAQNGSGETAEGPPAYVPPPAWKSVEIGDFYFHRKNYRGALSRYQEAIQTRPGYAPAYLGLGRVYEKLEEDKQALSAYRKYLDALPSEEDAKKAMDAHRAIRRLEREMKRQRKSAPRKSDSSG